MRWPCTIRSCMFINNLRNGTYFQTLMAKNNFVEGVDFEILDENECTIGCTREMLKFIVECPFDCMAFPD